ncbi:redoxin domain-containing protein [Paraglaciecola aquimarina]|uniref:Redoxin domain-containing protein n=1 Tax=Paraglaciecola aquimarina TaxID=1235557 RepID=A0ABU3SYZ8_9ALTE|nr:redoxin domain-containing protein [Paraglaciecola aquimarina]MDU0355231.1 redoxin domain-containing protein [Paraglaciecola aquimarina]
MRTMIEPGNSFPEFFVKSKDNIDTPLTRVAPAEGDWQMVVVYRGVHCPKCAEYLNELNQLHEEYKNANIDIVAVSADSVEQLNTFLQDKVDDLHFEVLAELSEVQMTQLGLYVSSPRSPKETDHPFAEPCILVINPDNKLHIVDKSNAPFSRPDLSKLLNGITFIQGNDYPIRGTYKSA